MKTDLEFMADGPTSSKSDLTQSQKVKLAQAWERVEQQLEGFADNINNSLQDVSEDVRMIREMIGKKETRALKVWHAITHGFGVTKKEIDKLFKD